MGVWTMTIETADGMYGRVFYASGATGREPIEVVLTFGEGSLYFGSIEIAERAYEVLKLAIDAARDVLDERIQCVHEMALIDNARRVDDNGPEIGTCRMCGRQLDDEDDCEDLCFAHAEQIAGLL